MVPSLKLTCLLSFFLGALFFSELLMVSPNLFGHLILLPCRRTFTLFFAHPRPASLCRDTPKIERINTAVSNTTWAESRFLSPVHGHKQPSCTWIKEFNDQPQSTLYNNKSVTERSTPFNPPAKHRLLSFWSSTSNKAIFSHFQLATLPPKSLKFFMFIAIDGEQC